MYMLTVQSLFTTSIFAIILMPLLLVYFLAIFYILERYSDLGEQKPLYHWKDRVARDAAIMAVAIDIAESIRSFAPTDPQLLEIELDFDLILPAILLIFHLTGLIVSTLFHRKDSLLYTYFQLYLAFILLVTNAITVKGLIGML